jgi:hypothetical protein
MTDELLRAVGNTLVNGLNDAPRVATNICWVWKIKRKEFLMLFFLFYLVIFKFSKSSL